MENPLVTIICINYNQGRFIEECIDSVVHQSYKNLEIILMDDASEDDSIYKINRISEKYQNIRVLINDQNIGNCKTFNLGFRESSGEFVLDLACDDLLEPNMIERSINRFISIPKDYGVHHSQVTLIDEDGAVIGHDNPVPPNEGDLYKRLISEYFVNPASMLIRREVLEELGGYDENLFYEDFDFWIRSSRKWKYTFTSEPLVKKRIVKGSHSSSQNKFFNQHQKSTLLVCQKILSLNREEDENQALKKRIKYEVGQCFRTGNIGLIPAYLRLWIKAG